MLLSKILNMALIKSQFFPPRLYGLCKLFALKCIIFPGYLQKKFKFVPIFLGIIPIHQLHPNGLVFSAALSFPPKL